jgi:hypothetical protein
MIYEAALLIRFLDYFWNLLIAARYNFQTVSKRPYENDI